MSESCCKPVDPRVLRTRGLLHTALEGLLKTRRFEELSVQDITDAATVNRATFYDHFPDKFALLESTVADRFHGLLARRGVKFGGCCASAVRAIILGVYDFLSGPVGVGQERQRRLEPHMESAMVAVVRAMLLDGLQQHPMPRAASTEMCAAAVGWAIYGGIKEWVQTSGHESSAEAVECVWRLVSPLLGHG